jgi:hypothetical protein
MVERWHFSLGVVETALEWSAEIRNSMANGIDCYSKLCH